MTETNYAWTWDDYKGAWTCNEYKGTVPSNKLRVKKRSSKFDRHRELPVERPKKPRDPMLSQLTDGFTAKDGKLLVESGVVCNTTLYHWQIGKTRCPRIDTLRRVADFLNKEIQLVDKVR